jgi:hypothetical protein
VPGPRRIKRTVRSPQEEPAAVVEPPAPIVVPQPIPLTKPEPEPAAIVPIEKPKPKPAVIEPKVIPKPKPIVNDYPRLTKIYFSPILNPGLLQFELRDGVEISILEKTSPNDLVFELRRKIAERVREEHSPSDYLYHLDSSPSPDLNRPAFRSQESVSISGERYHLPSSRLLLLPLFLLVDLSWH